MGANGVDNTRMWFNNLRVPKDNLLNRFGDIDKNGNYISPIQVEFLSQNMIATSGFITAYG